MTGNDIKKPIPVSTSVIAQGEVEDPPHCKQPVPTVPDICPQHAWWLGKEIEECKVGSVNPKSPYQNWYGFGLAQETVEDMMQEVELENHQDKIAYKFAKENIS